MTAVAFDPDRHEYRVAGRLVPNVTRILGSLYDFSSVPPAVLEQKRAIGVAVHRAIEFDLADDLDDATIDHRIEGYIAAWRKYRRERKYRHVHSERRVFHPGFNYAGTLDLFGHGLGYRNKPAPLLIDLKTTFDVHPAVALQTAAYQNALAVEYPAAKTSERMALQLKPDGNYREHWFQDPKDWPVFLAFLTTENWKGLHQ